MLTLAVDTSTLAGSVAVLRDERVLGILGASSEETYSSRLFRQIRLLLAELRLSLEQIDLYAVAAGPGSFTGLRVGLAAAKGWAEAFGKPGIAVSVLEAIASRSTAHDSLRVPVLDARRGQLFGAIYERKGSDLSLCGEEVVLAPDEFIGLLEQRAGSDALTVVTPTPEVIQPALEGSALRHAEIERVSPLLADTIGRLGYRRALRGGSGDALALDANYVRRSDAELKWKA